MDKINIDKVLENIDWSKIHKDYILNSWQDRKIVISKDGSHKVVFSDMPLESCEEYIIGVLNCSGSDKKTEIIEKETKKGECEHIFEGWKNQIKEQYSLTVKYLNMTNF